MDYKFLFFEKSKNAMIHLLSKHLEGVQSSPTLSLNALVSKLKKEGKNVINLTVGEPDFDTPNVIKEAAIDAIHKGHTKYTPVEGILPLREAILERMSCDFGLDFELNQVVVGNGAKQLIFNALYATLNRGDEVLIPTPYWVSYPDMVRLCGGVVRYIIGEESTFKITPKSLESMITEKTRWVILNSPSNPTGALYSFEELKGIADVLLKYPRILVLTDDIYASILFDGLRFFNIAMVEKRLLNRVLIVNGVSKSHAMTGWRLGFALGPCFLIKAMTIIQSQTTSNPCSISQYAALKALQTPFDELGEWVKIYQDRRDFLLERLNAIKGFSVRRPNGAFYLYVNCEGLIQNSKGRLKNDDDVSKFLLEDALVSTVPGVCFGFSPYIRLSYAVSLSVLEEACDRLESLPF